MDLSEIASNMDSFYTSPILKQDWEKYKLSQDQVLTYKRQGYLMIDTPTFTEEICDLFLSDYVEILNLKEGDEKWKLFYEFHHNQSGDNNNTLFHVLGHWRVSALFHDLIYHPALTVPTSQLLADVGEEFASVRFWHDQLFAKPPKHGGVVAWHQDYSYWTRTKPMRHMTVHIALDEQTIENGCIHYVPRSHKWTRDGGTLPVTDYNFGDMESIKMILNEDELKDFSPEPCSLSKGQIVFHHPLAVHGSYNNRSEKPRRAAVVNYFADGVLSATNDLLLNGADVIKKGNKMSGKFFPLVFYKTVMM